MQFSAEETGRAEMDRETFWNVPNVITLARIGATPLLLLTPFFSGPYWSTFIGFGFLAVALTDLVDGYLARRFDTITRFGKLLDPLADKLLVMTALIVLVAMGRIPDWGVPLVILLLSREMAVNSLRAMASAEGVILPASNLGKWKTAFQTAALTALLVHYPLLGLPAHELGMVLLVFATGLTLYSGWVYFSSYLGRSRSGPPGPRRAA